MNPGRRKDGSSSTPSPPGDGREGFVTSEELFGDLVDSPPEPTHRTGVVREAPIRVQVSEPSPATHAPAGPAPARVLPEDVAALLDAFSEPGEAATRSSAATAAPEKRSAAVEDSDGLLEALGSSGSPPPSPGDPTTPGGEAEPPRPAKRAAPGRGFGSGHGGLPPPGVAGPGEEGRSFDRLLDSLEETPEPPAAESPKTPEDSPPEPPMEFDALLDGMLEGEKEAEPPPAAAPEVLENDLLEGMAPGPASGGAKFHVAPPKSREAPAEAALDLAALADAALGLPAERPKPPEPVSEPTFGPYRLLERIAVGGMAEVLRAKRTGVEGFEKVLAVKRILSHLSDNKEFVDMFINEAKMVAGLAHPNIVQILDLGKLDTRYFIAMEYVHGRDLRTIQKRAKERGLRIPLDLSILVVSKVCAALEYAHRKKGDKGRPMQIVHRDISPQNILISFEGEVKLTDFGIAKAATKAPTTDAGALRGKLLYMSPEQAWGKPMDRRSDLFSLGIVFYELLTEQKPFVGNSEMSILETVRQCKIAAPTTVNPRIPEKLERVVMKALDRDPEQRYQDATEMFRDLDRVLPERKAASGVELTRFMEVLFDEQEREASPGEEPSLGEERHGAQLEIELDNAPPGQAETPGAGQDPMSIQKLLKRFGIK